MSEREEVEGPAPKKRKLDLLSALVNSNGDTMEYIEGNIGDAKSVIIFVVICLPDGVGDLYNAVKHINAVERIRKKSPGKYNIKILALLERDDDNYSYKDSKKRYVVAAKELGLNDDDENFEFIDMPNADLVAEIAKSINHKYDKLYVILSNGSERDDYLDDKIQHANEFIDSGGKIMDLFNQVINLENIRSEQKIEDDSKKWRVCTGYLTIGVEFEMALGLYFNKYLMRNALSVRKSKFEIEDQKLRSILLDNIGNFEQYVKNIQVRRAYFQHFEPAECKQIAHMNFITGSLYADQKLSAYGITVKNNVDFFLNCDFSKGGDGDDKNTFNDEYKIDGDTAREIGLDSIIYYNKEMRITHSKKYGGGKMNIRIFSCYLTANDLKKIVSISDLIGVSGDNTLMEALSVNPNELPHECPLMIMPVDPYSAYSDIRYEIVDVYFDDHRDIWEQPDKYKEIGNRICNIRKSDNYTNDLKKIQEVDAYEKVSEFVDKAFKLTFDHSDDDDVNDK